MSIKKKVRKRFAACGGGHQNQPIQNCSQNRRVESIEIPEANIFHCLRFTVDSVPSSKHQDLGPWDITLNTFLYFLK